MWSWRVSLREKCMYRARETYNRFGQCVRRESGCVGVYVIETKQNQSISKTKGIYKNMERVRTLNSFQRLLLLTWTPPVSASTKAAMARKINNCFGGSIQFLQDEIISLSLNNDNRERSGRKCSTNLDRFWCYALEKNLDILSTQNIDDASIKMQYFCRMMSLFRTFRDSTEILFVGTEITSSIYRAHDDCWPKGKMFSRPLSLRFSK